jgi:hypothetical protein
MLGTIGPKTNNQELVVLSPDKTYGSSTVPLNPLAYVYENLGNIGSCFTQYHWIRYKLKWAPTTSALSNGAITIGYQSDPAGA